MTDAEWRFGSDPFATLEQLLGKPEIRPRKLRLFALACCRNTWSRLNKSNRKALKVAERYADGLATWRELNVACSARGGIEPPELGHLIQAAVRGAVVHDKYLPHFVPQTLGAIIELGGPEQSQYASRVLRDIFGNAFPPVNIAPQWRTSDVLSLAQTIYDERSFDRLPELADALEEAGCGHAQIFEHLREPGLHVKGCWALDLVLGRT